MKIEEIVLKSKNGKMIKISLEDAENLYRELKIIFDNKQDFIPYYPIYIETYPKPNNPFFDKYTVTCADSVSVTNQLDN